MEIHLFFVYYYVSCELLNSLLSFGSYFGELLFTSQNLQFLGSSMYPTIPKNWQSEVGREDEKLVPSMTVYKSIQVLVSRYACEPHFIALLNIFLYLNLYPSDN